MRGPGGRPVGAGGRGAGSLPCRCRGAGSPGSPGPVRPQAVEHRRSGTERHGTAAPESGYGAWRRVLRGGTGRPAGRVGTPGLGQRCHGWRGVGYGERCRRFCFLCFKMSLVPRAPHPPRVVLPHPGPPLLPTPLTPSAAGWSPCVGQAPSLGAAACPGAGGKAAWGSGAEQSPGTRAVWAHRDSRRVWGGLRWGGGHPSPLWHGHPHGGI